MSYASAVKDKVEVLMKERGVKHADFIRHLGIGSTTYYEMWDNGYVTVDRLIGIAEVLHVPAATLLPDEHRGEVLNRKPGDRPYVEDRLEAVEREVRSLRNQLKNQTKK